MNVYIRNIHIYPYIMTSKKPLCFHAVHEFFVVVSFPWGTFCTEACRHGGATKKSCLSGGCSLEYLNSPPPKSLKQLHNFEPRKTGKHRQMFFCPILVMFFFFLKGCFGLHFLRAVEAGRGRHWRVQSSQSLFRAFCGEFRRTESWNMLC